MNVKNHKINWNPLKQKIGVKKIQVKILATHHPPVRITNLSGLWEDGIPGSGDSNRRRYDRMYYLVDRTQNMPTL